MFADETISRNLRPVHPWFSGSTRLVGWVQQDQLTALIECLTVILEYIDLFQILLVGHSQFLIRPQLILEYATGNTEFHGFGGIHENHEN